MATAIIVVEMMGKPADYLKKSLEAHVDRLNHMKGVRVKSIKVNDAKELDNSQGFFSCFAEIEFKVETLKELFDIVFDYMPSSVEVLEPAHVDIDTIEATALLNNLAGRLHRYDEAARAAKLKADHLLKQVQIATKVLEDNGLAKDGKLVDNIAKKVVAGENTGAKKKAKKKVLKKKSAKKKK
jgi:hypothetical protein